MFIEEGRIVVVARVGRFDEFEAQMAAGGDLAAEFEGHPAHRVAGIDLAEGA